MYVHMTSVSVCTAMVKAGFPCVGLDIKPTVGMEVRLREERRTFGHNWLPFDAVGKITSVLHKGQACEVRCFLHVFGVLTNTQPLLKIT